MRLDNCHSTTLITKSSSLRLTLHRSVSFFFNEPATTEIYTLSLHDALPILNGLETLVIIMVANKYAFLQITRRRTYSPPRSEERFSRNAETDLVCRLLLEKKKITELANPTTTTKVHDTCMICPRRVTPKKPT